MSFIAEIQANIDDFNSNLDKAQARMDAFANGIGSQIAKIGQSFQMIGGALSIGVTAPLVAAGTAAFNMAADFEDALGATDQIFKEASAATQEWANSLPTYFGIAKKEALDYSNMMGSMLVNIGNMTEQEASKQSAKLIELAGDLTAMYGGTTQDAVRALTGALKGNTTMLDNYGMAANDALVKAKAYSMGLAEQGKELDLAAKQAATLALIYEQSSAAQGQAAREAEGASGSMRALKTEIANLTTELGANLLPIITPIVNQIKEVAAGFRSLTPEAQKTITVVAAIAAAIGPLLLALGSLMQLAPLVGTAFATMTGPIGIAVAAIGTAVVLIIKYWDEIKSYFSSGGGSKVWASISKGAQDLWAKLVNIFEKVREFMLDVWSKIGSNVKSIVGNTFNTVLAIVEAVINHISGVIDVFSALLSGDFSGAIRAAGRLFENVFNTIKNIGLNVFANISQAIAGFLKLVGADQMGASLENWANGLRPVKQDVEQTAIKVEEATKKIATKTATVDSNTAALTKNTKANKDYRAELDNTLASWGIYDAQMKVITRSFNEIEKVARNAGASFEEFQVIASREWAEKTLVNFKKLEDGIKGYKLPGLSGPDISMPTANQTTGAFEGLSKELDSITPTLIDDSKKLVDGINGVLASGISSGVSGMFSSVGEALANGGNVMQAIGDQLVAGLGNLAKSIGEQMIQFGVAGIALKKLAMNPYLALAAGAALVALGSMASASIGKQASSYNGSSASYSSSATTSNSTVPRGGYFNNDRQEVVFKLKNGDLEGAVKFGEKRNNRLG